MLDISHILQLFILFKQGDKQLVSQLQIFNADAIREGEWFFSLPELYHFSKYYYQLAQPDYITFRRLLFNSSLNQQLAQYSARVNIAEPGHSVDFNIYQLAALDLNQP